MITSAKFGLQILVVTGLLLEPKIYAGAAPEPSAKAEEGPVDEAAAPVKSKLDFSWLPFPDETKFKIYGLHWFGENNPKFWRMPASQMESLPKGVQRQARSPSGARLLLRCNTSKLALKVYPLVKGGSRGLDVYVDGKFYKSAVAEEPKVETDLVLFKEFDNEEKEIWIYFPHHQELLLKAVGVDAGTRFTAPAHQFARSLPVVFYGSSVCQGSGALKPGMTYEAIACRGLNLDFVNLGFGGAGKAETNVVALVNSIPACCYVFDLGKSYGMQDATAFKSMLETTRKSHPGVPIICMTPITSALELHSDSYARRSEHTRKVMRDPTLELIRSGQKSVYLLEGKELLTFDEHDGLSKDGLHPLDHGYAIIAGRLSAVLRQALRL